jgi:hypothetical protein
MQGDIGDLVEIIIWPKLSTDYRTTKPDAYRMHVRVMKIGVYGVDLVHLHQETGLFSKLTLCRLPHILVILDIAARDTPGALVDTTSAASKDDTVFVHDNDSDTHDRILPEDKRASRTHQALTVVDNP